LNFPDPQTLLLFFIPQRLMEAFPTFKALTLKAGMGRDNHGHMRVKNVQEDASAEGI
jgi:hypothetical protein